MEFERARVNPSPYNVVRMQHEDFKAMTSFLQPVFKAACPIPTRPIREIFFYSWNSCCKIQEYLEWRKGHINSVCASHTKSTESVKQCHYWKPREGTPWAAKNFLCEIQRSSRSQKMCSPNNHHFYDELPYDGALPNNMHDDDSDDMLHRRALEACETKSKC